MAAVRCEARRLGVSLLQRTQAEERRRLVPSRLIRSRELTSEQAREIKQKKKALYEAQSNVELWKQELHDALAKAGETPDQHLSVKRTRQQPSPERILMYGRLAQGVLGFVVKTTFFVSLTVAMVDVAKYNRSRRVSSEDKV